jgi:nucleoside phosphorylase
MLSHEGGFLGSSASKPDAKMSCREMWWSSKDKALLALALVLARDNLTAKRGLVQPLCLRNSAATSATHNVVSQGSFTMKRAYFRIEEYTVGWVCALPIELAAAAEMLDEEHQDIPEDRNDTNLYTVGRISDCNVVIACLPAGQMGTNSAAAVASQMRSKFVSIKFGLMVGIGGGVPSEESDIRLGDVVISQPHLKHGGVVQYDLGKTGEGGKFTRTGSLNAPPVVLLNALSKFQSNHLRRRSNLFVHLSTIVDRLPDFAAPRAESDILFEKTCNHTGRPTCNQCSKNGIVERALRKSEEIVIHYGTIASGNQVIKDSITRDNLSSEIGDVLCFEMEAAGLMNNFPCLIIRGICDYADSHKNKKWQHYAAATAAACAKELLSLIPSAEVEETYTVQRSVSGQIQNTFNNRGNVSNQAGQQNIYGDMIINQ